MIINPSIKNQVIGAPAHIIASAPHGATVSCDGVAGSEVRTVNPAWKGVPSWGTQVEYIQSSGTQYIDLTYVPTSTSNYKLKINSQNISERAIFGSDWALNASFLMFYNNNIRWHCATALDVPCSLDTDYEVECNVNGGLVINGTSYSSTASSSLNSNPLSIFYVGSHVSTYITKKGIFKLYYYQIFNGITLKHYFVPMQANEAHVAYKGSTQVTCSVGEYGLYDLVEGKFYINSGTGSFTAGSEVPHYLYTSTWTFDIDTYGEHTVVGEKGSVTDTETVNVLTATDYLVTLNLSRLPSGYTEVEYIEGTGNQYINTQLNIPYNAIYFDLDMAWTEEATSTERSMIGMRDTNALVFIRLSAYAGDSYMNGGYTYNNWASWGQQKVNVVTNQVINTRASVKYLSPYTLTKADGTTVTTTHTTKTTSTYPVYLFSIVATDMTSGYHPPAKAKCWSAKIYNGTTLVFDGVPCLNSSNQVGMYDLVSEAFFSSVTGTEFIAGNPV